MAVMRSAAALKYLRPEDAQSRPLSTFRRNGGSSVIVFLLHYTPTISDSMKQLGRRERNAAWLARKLLRAVACKSDGADNRPVWA
jgi:hypothetical protein